MSLPRINSLVFFISLAIGFLFVYMITPPPEVIIKFPSPFNVGKITYKDKSDNCYVYQAEKVACESVDKSLLLPQPITENFTQRKTK